MKPATITTDAFKAYPVGSMERNSRILMSAVLNAGNVTYGCGCMMSLFIDGENVSQTVLRRCTEHGGRSGQ